MITVVVPVWDDYVPFLGDCLESIRVQRGVVVQVIVVDNASRTPIPAVAEDVEVLRLKRRVGVGEARNAALAAARAGLVCFFDVDDRMLPGMLERMYATIESHPNVVGVVGRHLTWDPRDGATTDKRRLPRPIVFRISPHQRVFALSNVIFNSFLVAGGLYRTRAVEDAGGFGAGSLGEDWLLAIGLCFRGRLVFVDEPLFLHRVAAGSLWNRRHDAPAFEALYADARRRIAADRAVPAWVRLTLPLVHLVHRVEVRRRSRPAVAIPPAVVDV